MNSIREENVRALSSILHAKYEKECPNSVIWHRGVDGFLLKYAESIGLLGPGVNDNDQRLSCDIGILEGFCRDYLGLGKTVEVELADECH